MGAVANVVPDVLHHGIFQEGLVVFARAVLAVNHGTVKGHHPAERVAHGGRLLVTGHTTHAIQRKAVLEELGHGVVLLAEMMRVEVTQRRMA